MGLAVTTGVSFREWLRDPAAMVTALEILAELGERANPPGPGG